MLETTHLLSFLLFDAHFLSSLCCKIFYQLPKNEILGLHITGLQNRDLVPQNTLS